MTSIDINNTIIKPHFEYGSNIHTCFGMNINWHGGLF